MPLYFGRVGGLVIETRDMTTDQAEVLVDRQARAFELAKPYLVERWRRAAATPAAGEGDVPERGRRISDAASAEPARR